MEDDVIKKLIWFRPVQVAAIEAYARDNGLEYGGKPHFSAAVRQLISLGLGMETELHELKPGPKQKNTDQTIDNT